MTRFDKAVSLRILYHHRIAASDGMRVHIAELVRALRDRGHVVKIVGPGAENGQQTTSHRLEGAADALRRLLPAFAFELAELAYNFAAYLRLRREVRAFRPEIIYERYNLFLLAGLVLKRRRRIPLILEVNSPLASERAAFGRLSMRAVARWCERALWRGADAVLPVTRVLADQVVAVRGEEADVYVVPNGADLHAAPKAAAVAEVRSNLGLPTDAIVLGFVGFVRAWHGVGWALEALAHLPRRTHLVVVGDGPALADLGARAAAMGLAPRVHLTGRVVHEAVAAYTELFDVALQTAAVPYASPLKLFEYMARGRAIIAPDQPNIREVLADGENSLLFREGDPESFQQALSRLVHDEPLRARLGAGARRTVEQTPFTWSHNAKRVGELGRRLKTAYGRR